MKSYETPMARYIRLADGDIVRTSEAGRQLSVDGNGYGDGESY